MFGYTPFFKRWLGIDDKNECLCTYKGVNGRATRSPDRKTYTFKGDDNVTFAQIPAKDFHRVVIFRDRDD